MENKGILDKIVSFLKNLVKDLKEAYKGLSPESRIAAEVKESITTNEQIISLFSDVAAKAVENYNLQEEGQKNNTSGEVLFDMRSNNTDKVFVKYKDYASEIKAIKATVARLNESKKYITISKETLESHAEINSSDYKSARKYIKDILKKALGVSVYLRNGENYVEAYLTKDGLNHSAVGVNDSKRATALSEYFELIRNAVYSFSSVDDKHNTSSANIDGKIEWESYVALAKIDGEDFYVLFRIRAIDSDVRKQIYAIATKNEIGSIHDPGISDGLSNYDGTPTSKKKLSQSQSVVKPESMKSSRTATIGQDLTETPQFRRWFGDSVVTNPDGTPKVLYHQTNNDFTVFDTRHAGAGTSDNGTPFGIFMKSDDRNIGLRGDKQMALYASIQNPLTVNNREHLYRQISRLSEEYTSILKHRESLDSEYHKRLEDNEHDQMEYIKQWRGQNPGVSSRQLYNDDAFKAMLDKDDTILDEWKAAGKKLDTSAKEVITKVLEANGYDGVIIREDAGSFGRKTDAYIALHPEQVKSATDNVGTFDRDNPDIRFSTRNAGEDVKTVLANYKAQRDAVDKAHKALYEQERKNLAEAHSRRMSELKAEYSADSKVMEQEFMRLLRSYETEQRRTGKKDERLDTLRKRLETEAKSHREDNAAFHGIVKILS